MIAPINEKPVHGASCQNCHTPLANWIVETNRGKQAMYACANENCPHRGKVSVCYWPPAQTEAQPDKKEDLKPQEKS